MSRTVISGGAGFIGSHLCDELIAKGHVVIAVDNFITGRKENVEHLLDHSRFELIEHDICEPFEVAGRVDYVLHLASPASPPDFERIPLETLRAGSYGTHVMLDLAREKDADFLLASTSEVYGDPPAEQHPQREEYWGNVNPVGARSVYDEAKRYAETATMAYHRSFGLKTHIARIFNTYGPRMHADDGRVVTNFIRQTLQGEPITIYGEGTQTRSFSYVSDTVEALIRLLMSDEPMPVNVGNPKECTVLELAERILELTGGTSEIVREPQPFEDDPKQRKPDISRARAILDWEPIVDLDDGLTRSIAFLRKELGLDDVPKAAGG